MHHVIGIVALLGTLIASPTLAQTPGYVHLTADSVRGDDGYMLRDAWLFHPGDDPTWADPQLDEADWVPRRSHHAAYPSPDWTGRGWFRLHLLVDSALVNVPLGLHMVQAGASIVYLDGRPILRLGQIARGDTAEVARWDQTFPHPILLTRRDHVLAVRYTNVSTTPFTALGFGQGFHATLGELAPQIEGRVQREGHYRTVQVVFSVVPAMFTLLHLFLFLLYPRDRNNLYYAMLTAFIAASNFLGVQAIFAHNPAELIALFRWSSICYILYFLFGLRFAYSLWMPRLPRPFYAFLAAAVGLIAWRMVVPSERSAIFTSIYTFAVLAEVLRVVISTRRVRGVVGAIVGVGITLAIVLMMLQVLQNLGLLPAPTSFPFEYLGVLFLLLTMSLYLSDRFARTSRHLEHRLEQVRTLTKRTLQQEREAREMTYQRRLLQAQNERQTEELEAARRLQLSMLPRQLPHLDQLALAAHMQTATEVGGDYYDCHVHEDGTLTLAIGDATGHGTPAGIMVAAVKALFTAVAGYDDLRAILHRCTSIIKPMNLGPHFMAFQLARLTGNRLSVTSAGMPFPLLYRAATGGVETLELRGAPLGFAAGYPYELIERTLEPGDVVLLMSDGLLELRNARGEEFGRERVAAGLSEAAAGSPDDVVGHILAAARHWHGDVPPRDDVTLIALQARPTSTLQAVDTPPRRSTAVTA